MLKKFISSRYTSTFEKVFDQEIVAVERKRATILAAILGIGALLLIPGIIWFAEDMQRLLNSSDAGKYLAITFLVAFFYELAVIRVLTIFQKRKWAFPELSRYLNALIETSLPTAFIIQSTIFTQRFNDFQANLTLMYTIFIILSAMRLSFRLCVWTGSVAAVGYAIAWFGWGQHYADTSVLTLTTINGLHIERLFILLGLGGVAGIIAQQIRLRVQNTMETMQERNRIASIFGQHVSPEVMDTLLAQKQAEFSELRFVCIMFLDIRSFTSYAEQTSPQLVIRYLNTVFDNAIRIINDNNGIVNKFLGDGLMAVFGAPIASEHECVDAVQAAQEIIIVINQLVATKQIPATRVGIGLHAGDAITGTIGSTQRQEYTIIGDVVNVAARIEQKNKELHSQVLISERVWQDLNGSAPHDAEILPDQILRGRQQPMTLVKLA